MSDRIASNRASLTPFGRTMPIAAERLEHPPAHNPDADPEVVLMRLWEKENTPGQGPVPIRSILHECNDQCGNTGIFNHFHALVDSASERDIKVASAMLQWLATNCGREFLERFFRQIGCKIVFIGIRKEEGHATET